MNIQTFLDGVAQNAARVKSYQLGCDGTNGRCDCIGLIIGAFRLLGESWTGTHGSNYAARYQVQKLHKVRASSALAPGQMVFKCREKGEKGYALPKGYQSHADQRDYYHVGVVTNCDPLVILHCSGGGMHRDDKPGAWRYAGYPVQVDLPVRTVQAENGGSVNVRERPDLSARRTGCVKTGGTVGWIRDVNAAWAQVQTEEGTGYMMKNFLRPDEDGVTVSLDVQTARAFYEALSRVLKFS